MEDMITKVTPIEVITKHQYNNILIKHVHKNVNQYDLAKYMEIAIVQYTL